MAHLRLEREPTHGSTKEAWRAQWFALGTPARRLRTTSFGAAFAHE